MGSLKFYGLGGLPDNGLHFRQPLQLLLVGEHALASVQDLLPSVELVLLLDQRIQVVNI